MTLKSEDSRKVPMSGFSCKQHNQDWVRGYALATGQKASEIVDKALDEFRAKHDIESDMDLAEERLVETLLTLYNYKEQIKTTMSDEEATARRSITAYLRWFRGTKEYNRNLISQEEFNKKLRNWLLENVCPQTGVRIEKAAVIAKKIWVLLELESKESAVDETRTAETPPS